MAKKKKAEIPARFKDQEKSHRLHRSEQSQFPDEGQVSDLNEKGQSGGGRNPREIAGQEGGGSSVENQAGIPEPVEK